MKRKIICAALALGAILPATAAIAAAAGPAPQCADLLKAVPEKVGDLPLVKKDCKFITPEMAKTIHATAGARYLEAYYEQKSPARYIRLQASLGDPAVPDAKGNAEIIAKEKDNRKDAQTALASGIPDAVKIGKDYMAHMRIVPLSHPEEAKLVWHEGPTPNAEVQGVADTGAFVSIEMSAADVDGAVGTLNLINSSMKYALLH